MADEGDGWMAWKNLYAPFPDARTDETAWDNKMNFWVSTITRLCATRKTAIFSISELQKDFERNGKVPQCLGFVVQQMVAQGSARRLSFYVREHDHERTAWSAWDVVRSPVRLGFELIRQPAAWLIRKFLTGDSTKDQVADDAGTYVVCDMIKTIAEGLMEIRRERISLGQDLIEYKSLAMISSPLVSDDASLRLSLIHLEKLNKCKIVAGRNEEKVVDWNASGSDSSTPSCADLGLLRLRSDVAKIESAIATHVEQLESLKKAAKDCMERNCVDQAKKLWTRRALVEKTLGTKERVLERLHGLIANLELMQFQKEAMDAIKTGINCCDEVKKEGLTVDDVDGAMLNLQTVSEEVEEIDSAIAMPVYTPWNLRCDEDEVLNELNELLDLPSHSDRQTRDSANLGFAERRKPESPMMKTTQGSERTSAIQFPETPNSDPERTARKEPASTLKGKKGGKLETATMSSKAPDLCVSA